MVILQNIFFILLVLRLGLFLYQRRYNKVGLKKRVAGLYQSLILGGFYLLFTAIVLNKAPVSVIPLFLCVCGVVIVLAGKHIFPYSLTCSCGKKLSLTEILFIDSNNCSECSGQA